MTLKMTTAQVVETSVTVTNSSFRNYTHPDDHTTRTTDNSSEGLSVSNIKTAIQTNDLKFHTDLLKAMQVYLNRNWFSNLSLKNLVRQFFFFQIISVYVFRLHPAYLEYLCESSVTSRTYYTGTPHKKTPEGHFHDFLA